MAIRLDTRAADFAQKFRAFLDTKREAAADVDAMVRAIVADVAARGDRALRDYTQKFDGFDLASVGLRVTPQEMATALERCERKARDAIEFARDRIEVFHRRQVPQDDRFTDALGVELGTRWTAIEAVGLYVPGGTAAYPSSVLMNAVPAKVAGVPRLVMVVPAPGGVVAPLVLAAAKLAGVDEVYRVGGAQAIAALAYGTATIAPVAKIIGPGNAYVAAAKRIVFGKVGIDMIAGPSEVLILADHTGNADWIAADLLAQAEHDPSAQAILITDDEKLAAAVERAVENALMQSVAQRGRRRLLARFRRGGPGARSRRSRAADRRRRPRASGNRDGRRRAAGAAHPQCRCDLHRRAHPGGDRRLRRRLQPRAADGAVSAVLVRAGRPRFHEAHLDPQMRAGAVAGAGRRRHHARHGGGARRPCPFRRHSAQSLMPRPDRDKGTGRLVAVTIDESSIGRSNSDVEHERAVAIYDLIEENAFRPHGHEGGPYALNLGISGNRLVFDIRTTDGTPVIAHLLSLAPFRRIVKDYFTVCDSYYAAIRGSTPDRIEALDMARRSLHDEGSQILMERLKRKVELDFDTARRLFTLVTVLHWKG